MKATDVKKERRDLLSVQQWEGNKREGEDRDICETLSLTSWKTKHQQSTEGGVS